MRLVIIDPISAYLGKTDSHVTAKVRGLLAPLIYASQVLRFAVIFLEHLNKSNLKAVYRSSGSIGFIAAARAAWCFGQDPDEPEKRLMLPVKMNLAPQQRGLSYRIQETHPNVPAVAWGEAVSVTADAILQPENIEERSERLEATDWLRDQLSKGPVSAKKIREEANGAGLAWRTLRRAKDAIGAISRKGAFEEGWYWQLPEGVQDTPKVSTSKAWTPSVKVDTFGTPGSRFEVDGLGVYTADQNGPGCTCKACGCHFETIAGWRSHIAGKRCTPKTEAAD